MTRDRRRFACNGRVAHVSLAGEVGDVPLTEGRRAQVDDPVADLLADPGGRRDRQLLLGAAVRVLEERDGFAFVMAEADGYCGYMWEDTLADPGPPPTHRVSARATHVYDRAEIKSPDRMRLSLGAVLHVSGVSNGFAETPLGHVPLAHLTDLTETESDPVAVAERLLGTPYLWGGNSSLGIDCSGLVQVALTLCGLDCPGDSDMQAAELGVALPEDAALQRGDLLFWKGHVAWVADDARLLHANAHHMAVAFEGIEAAIDRIAAGGDGPVTARRRLPGLATPPRG